MPTTHGGEPYAIANLVFGDLHRRLVWAMGAREAVRSRRGEAEAHLVAVERDVGHE
jgi:hypothetical protein